MLVSNPVQTPPTLEPGSFQYDQLERAREHALVLMARGIAFSMQQNPDGTWRVQVPETSSEAARYEIAGYDRENQNWPEKPHTFQLKSPELYTIPIFVGLLGLSYFLQIAQGSQQFFENNLASSEAIWSRNEWHRAFGALFLHGDLPHLLSNTLAISLFAAVLMPLLGSGLVWFGLVSSGFFGNLLNAYFYHEIIDGPIHRSLGASTASFGLIGLACGWRIVVAIKGRGKIEWRSLIAPVGVAAAFLSLLGSSKQTDVMAHLLGMLAGTLVGLAYGLSRAEIRLGDRAQLLLTITVFCGIGTWLAINWRGL